MVGGAPIEHGDPMPSARGVVSRAQANDTAADDNNLVHRPCRSGFHRDIPQQKGSLSSNQRVDSAVTNAVPGDSLAIPAYSEFGDSIATLSFVALAPVTIEVPAGRFEVLPLRSGGFRVFTTRSGVRRVVKGETLDGEFSFQLAGTGPVVPSPQ